MRRVQRHLPLTSPREAAHLHVSWLLGCLEPGVVLEVDDCRFRSIFGTPQDAASLREADELSRRKGCQFAYRLEDRVATFRRVEARGYAADF